MQHNNYSSYCFADLGIVGNEAIQKPFMYQTWLGWCHIRRCWLQKYSHWQGKVLATIIGFITGTLLLVYPWRTKSFLYSDDGNLILNAVGNPKFSNYNYFIPDFKDFQTYGVLLTIILGISLLFLLNYYDKKRTN